MTELYHLHFLCPVISCALPTWSTRSTAIILNCPGLAIPRIILRSGSPDFGAIPGSYWCPVRPSVFTKKQEGFRSPSQLRATRRPGSVAFGQCSVRASQWATMAAETCWNYRWSNSDQKVFWCVLGAMVLKYSSLSYPESHEFYELYEYQWWILYSFDYWRLPASVNLGIREQVRSPF